MNDTQIPLNAIRLQLNELDERLLEILSERRKLSIEAFKVKHQFSKPIRDLKREKNLLANLIEIGTTKHQLTPNYISQIFNTIIADSVLLQETHSNENSINKSDSE